MGAFNNTGFDTVSLHRPAMHGPRSTHAPAWHLSPHSCPHGICLPHVAPHVGVGSLHRSVNGALPQLQLSRPCPGHGGHGAPHRLATQQQMTWSGDHIAAISVGSIAPII